MAAPVDAARSVTSVITANTTFNIQVGSPPASRLLVVAIRFNNAPGGTALPNWTVFGNASSDASDDEWEFWWKLSDGLEGPTETMTCTISAKLAAICWQITGMENEQPTLSTVAVGTTGANVANPSSVAPNSPPQDTLYLAWAGGDGEVGAYTAAPTNYGNLAVANTGTGGAAAANCFVGGASRQIAASSSDDPGVFTHATHTTGWAAHTLAIRAPAAAAPGPVLRRRSAHRYMIQR